MGFPFTNAQRKELERQGLIYKYMVASIPIPIDLLLPLPISTSSSNPNNNTLVRYVNGKADMEAGRCKRTDGKKWRCSRDVAPNQKYCERHMNRGRPRSRKHVEPLQHNNNNNKKLRYYNNNNHHNHNHISIFTPTTSITNNQTHFLGGSSSTTSLPYYHYPYNSSASSPPPPQSRNLEWMMGTEQQNQEWLHSMQSRMEITEKPEEELLEESFLNNICTTDCTTTTSSSSLYNDVVSHQTARSFIDAWSKTTTTTVDDDNNETTEVGNLSPSSLTLSMGNWVNPSTSDSCSWVSPLAEVFRQSAATAAGVLQKTTTTSLSGSSNSTSSPTAEHNPEIALFSVLKRR